MLRIQISPWKKLVVAAAVLACSLAVGYGAAPRGWILAGTAPAEYETRVDTDHAYQGHPSALLKSKQARTTGFGTLMQQISAGQYEGKRVRLSGVVKSEEVTGWAGLWMRVDKEKEVLAFDNMQDRAITGTGDWQRYNVVLDVPRDATGISFGMLLTGAGEVWLSGMKFEVVGLDVPTTNMTGKDGHAPSEPVNLDFTE